MNREDLRELSNCRLQEVRALRAAARFDGAYYLAGHVVELGLKAVIAKATRRHEFPDLGLARDSHIHDLQKLVSTAGLTTALLAESQADALFAANWAVVKDWSEISRYRRSRRSDADAIYHAITARRHGVLQWLRRHW